MAPKASITLSVFAALLLLLPATGSARVMERQAYGLAGVGFTGPTQTLGNVYNYWKKLPNGTMDLTRSDVMPVTTPKLIPFQGKFFPSALVEPSRTVLCIIDMQNFFLHPEVSKDAVTGRAAVEPTVNMIKAFRAHNMTVTWVNWGLTDYDLLTLPPAFKFAFSSGADTADKTFGSDMGPVNDSGATVQQGRMLMRGAWNAEPFGILGTMKDEGLAAKTDMVFHKNRLSGLWGAQTPFGTWLQENEITTIFFGGVNADQCVWSTLVDAYFKGMIMSFLLSLLWREGTTGRLTIAGGPRVRCGVR